MSRVVALGFDNMQVGQFDAIVPIMAWCLNGHPSVSGGGSTDVTVPDEVIAQPWLKFGRMVVASPTDLDAYIGMIDTPWSATSPAKMAIYDPEYLLNIRVDEGQPRKYKGTIDTIISQVIDTANAKEDLYLRMGHVQDVDRAYREEAFDGRPLWEQMKALLLKTGTEMKFRAGRGDDDRWYIYLDIARTMGDETDLLLVDGEKGNMQLKSATVKGEIWNRVVGLASQSTAQSRLQTSPIEDVNSRAENRMRNRFVQFRDVTDKSTLSANTLNSLALSSFPYLELVVDVLNIDHAFRSLRLGNRVAAHVQDIWLPGGRHGWRGMTRITKMALVSERIVNMTLVGAL